MHKQVITSAIETGTSPVGDGGVLAGAPSALQVRVKRALERYEDATFWANGTQKQEAINDLLDDLRIIANARPLMFTDQAEYERYTTAMEQAEERKS